MKTTMIIIALVSASLLVVATSAQERTSHNKHMMLMEFLKDSVMTDLMMDHFASDKQMYLMMTDKLVYYAVGDSSKMRNICQKIIDDRDMHSVMIKMLEEKTRR